MTLRIPAVTGVNADGQCPPRPRPHRRGRRRSAPTRAAVLRRRDDGLLTGARSDNRRATSPRQAIRIPMGVPADGDARRRDDDFGTSALRSSAIPVNQRLFSSNSYAQKVARFRRSSFFEPLALCVRTESEMFLRPESRSRGTADLSSGRGLSPNGPPPLPRDGGHAEAAHRLSRSRAGCRDGSGVVACHRRYSDPPADISE
jgi:hypothetical protein